MSEIKTTTLSEFEADYPEVCAKKRYYKPPTAKGILVTYAEKAGVAFCEVCEGSKRPYWVEFFYWNAKNNCDYRSFRTAEEAEISIESWFNSRLRSMKAKAEYRKKANEPHSLKVGDVLYASWGYDQTNVDYYKVTRTTLKTVDLVTIGKKSTGSNHVSPDPNAVGDKVYKRKRASKDNYVTIDSVRHASKCEPNSEHYETPWGMGH